MKDNPLNKCRLRLSLPILGSTFGLFEPAYTGWCRPAAQNTVDIFGRTKVDCPVETELTLDDSENVLHIAAYRGLTPPDQYVPILRPIGNLR